MSSIRRLLLRIRIALKLQCRQSVVPYCAGLSVFRRIEKSDSSLRRS